MWIKVNRVFSNTYSGLPSTPMPVIINTDNIAYITPGITNSIVHFLQEIKVSSHSKITISSMTIQVSGADLETLLTGSKLSKLIKLGIVE